MRFHLAAQATNIRRGRDIFDKGDDREFFSSAIAN